MRQLIIIVLLCQWVVNGITAQIYEPVQWTHQIVITGSNTGELVHRATIQDQWYMYGMNIPAGGPRPTTVVYETLQGVTKKGDLQAPSKLKEVFDEIFNMQLSLYSNEAIFIQAFTFSQLSAIKIEGYVEFMACDATRCLPPAMDEFSLRAPMANATTATSTNVRQEAHPTSPSKPVLEVSALTLVGDTMSNEVQAEVPIVSDLWRPVIDELRAFGDPLGNSNNRVSLWLIFIAGLTGGILALLTPCVWPIIPITVSFFLKRSEKKAKARTDALLYGLAIVFIYVLLGLLITLLFGASALNSLATNAVFNLLFFAMLVVFAISFFGAFEITLPASWSTKLDAKADSTAGVLSILFMAFTLVLVSFSCTGPIIGTLLVEVASTGSVLAPAVGMLGFALALAIPFTVLAFFPSLIQSMPKSGGWLNRVKVVLAFLVLALSLKFLSVVDLAYGWGILDREVFLSLWIVIFTLLGVYLLGKIKFRHDTDSKHTSVLGVFLAIISLSFAMYMVPGLWGAPLKAISAFAPPLSTQDFSLYENEVHPDFTHYEEGMRYAALMNKPVIVDFSGFGCVNCKKMEATVWTHPRVKYLLENKFVLITLYVDDKTPLDEIIEVNENNRTRRLRTVGDKWSYLQRTKFGANAQPFYVMIDSQGMPLTGSYSFDTDPENFIRWLERVPQ